MPCPSPMSRNFSRLRPMSDFTPYSTGPHSPRAWGAPLFFSKGGPPPSPWAPDPHGGTKCVFFPPFPRGPPGGGAVGPFVFCKKRAARISP